MLSLKMSGLEIVGMILLGISVGISKVGIPGAIISSPILSTVYGGQLAQTIIIPAVTASDFNALYFYGKDVDRKALAKTLPTAIVGVIIAIFFGKYISADIFKKTIAILIIFVCIVTILKNKNLDFSKFSMGFGALSGFSSTIGNVAGPLVSIYFLNVNLDKNKFYGTRTWFFFAMNTLKFILYAIVWRQFSMATFIRSCVAIPGVVIGVTAGKVLVSRFSQKTFEKFIIIFSLLSALNLLFGDYIKRLF
ncbi:sulfite exporter TauE/SafE family protein [Fusobacterium sp. PH5-44]|uniref:sulfite exporter TauE/SafE family protein n=1 Tax=unclassified Fusobacterium TaxID=2648384 RepID=UPI003D1FB2A5